MMDVESPQLDSDLLLPLTTVVVPQAATVSPPISPLNSLDVGPVLPSPFFEAAPVMLSRASRIC